MPCYKCNNGKYKYGERGRCQFDTKAACEAAERAIHARQNEPKKTMGCEGGCFCDCPKCRQNKLKTT